MNWLAVYLYMAGFLVTVAAAMDDEEMENRCPSSGSVLAGILFPLIPIIALIAVAASKLRLMFR